MAADTLGVARVCKDLRDFATVKFVKTVSHPRWDDCYLASICFPSQTCMRRKAAGMIEFGYMATFGRNGLRTGWNLSSRQVVRSQCLCRVLAILRRANPQHAPGSNNVHAAGCPAWKPQHHDQYHDAS